MAKKKTTRQSTRSSTGRSSRSPSAAGKHLVIVESPAKAKTINKYLGPDFIVQASVGHVRDLPSKSPKGDKRPVPGVDLESDFAPTYEVMPGKTNVVNNLKRAAKNAIDVWFATDLDREGEAIAWHLAQLLGVDPANAKRVVFNAITKKAIEHAFSKPLTIDENKVNAQQARRILDRIVGYQVSPLLWKKVARGLSAGRVQSVAVRLVVEREREIRSFTPNELWQMTARFTADALKAGKLASDWKALIDSRDEKDAPPTIKKQNAWMASHDVVKAELVEIAGKKFELGQLGDRDKEPEDLSVRAGEIAAKAGLINAEFTSTEDPDGKGPARRRRTIKGAVKPGVSYRVSSIETKRTSSRPSAPFITSTLQQAASSRLGFGAKRTMRTAQQLYEGVEIAGEGAVGLITYMRTDSTHLSDEAVNNARHHIINTFGKQYLPDKPRIYSSSNKAAQEAHEAIRPASLEYPPERVARALEPAQLKLYTLIWNRFLACQMTPAQWDSTSALIRGGVDPNFELTFRATGRMLVFDGFYRVTGVPTSSDEQTLPTLSRDDALTPISVEALQKFTSPPPRFSEASLIRTLESEGIGRPSTYAQIIQVIQDRRYVEQIKRRFYATDLGDVVTTKLVEAFPRIMEIGYTRELERQLDRVEEEHLDWVHVLHDFYKPFSEQLAAAHEQMVHAKAEIREAPDEYRCEDCGSSMVYRFGKSGRFLSCSQYPKCKYASPCDRDGKPAPIETSNVACLKCSKPMIKRSGRFGPFYGCSGYPECDGILKADKKTGLPLAPTPPPLKTDLPCPKCDATLMLRNGVRGPWLSCSNYPKCRGRGKWASLEPEIKEQWEKALAAHERLHPIAVVHDLDGAPLTDSKGKPLPPADPEQGQSDALDASAAA